jgi:nicotinamide-nucleotide amidase
MRYLTDKFVIPELLSLCQTLPVMRQRIIKLYGLNEPSIAEIFKALHGKTKDVVLGFYPRFPENHITASLRGETEADVTAELEILEDEIRRLVGPYIFATGNDRMEDVVGRMVLERGLSLSVAESCTGGMIGSWLTNVPGSSAYFQGGVISYSNQSKMDLLGVKGAALDKDGAVSDAAAQGMAMGVRDVLKTDLGLSVTGIAGPGGGTKKKPVGTVHVGLSAKGVVFSRKYRFWGTREQIRLNAAMMALDWVRRYLNGDPFLPGV